MTAAAPLTFVEEIVLLALDDTTGALLPMPLRAFNFTLAGALLADLAVRGRIDTDPQQLVVLRREPTGDALLDPGLAAIAAAGEPAPAAHWLGVFAEWRQELEAGALSRLVARGILRQENKQLLWVFGSRRYPTVQAAERTEVRTRLAALILGDELPDPSDAILLSLLSAGHLANTIFAGPEFKARAPRLATLAKMDLIGREVADGLDTISRALAGMVPPAM